MQIYNRIHVSDKGFFTFVEEKMDARQIKNILKTNEFTKHLGIEFLKIENGFAEIQLEIKEHMQQQIGFLHGGVTATLLDVATGTAAYSHAKEGQNVVTADLKVSYLHPATSKLVTAEGNVIKKGNFLCFCEGKVYDHRPEGKTLIATGSSIMCYIQKQN